MSQEQTIAVSRRGAVMEICITRPQVRNALDAACVHALSGAFAQAARDPAIRAVSLTGEGTVFCAGGDLKSIFKNHSPSEVLHFLDIEMRRPRTSRSISASVGRVATAVNSGFANVARQRCACHRQKRVIPKNLGQLALRNQPSSPLCACLRRPKRVLYLCSCGWISYPPTCHSRRAPPSTFPGGAPP